MAENTKVEGLDLEGIFAQLARDVASNLKDRVVAKVRKDDTIDAELIDSPESDKPPVVRKRQRWGRTKKAATRVLDYFAGIEEDRPAKASDDEDPKPKSRKRPKRKRKKRPSAPSTGEEVSDGLDPGGDGGGDGGNGDDSDTMADDADDSRRRQREAEEKEELKRREELVKRAKRLGAGLGLLVGVVATSVKAFRMLIGASDRLIESQRRYAEFSGSIAESMARLDADRIGRAQKHASSTASSTKYHTEARSDLEDEMQPYKALGTNLKNRFVGFMLHTTTTLSQVARIASPLLGALHLWGSKQGDEKPPAWYELLDNLAAGELDKPVSKRKV